MIILERPDKIAVFVLFVLWVIWGVTIAFGYESKNKNSCEISQKDGPTLVISEKVYVLREVTEE